MRRRHEKDLDWQLGGKQLELFRVLVPGLKRVMYPYDAALQDAGIRIDGFRRGAALLGIELVEQPLRTLEEARQVIGAIQKGIPGTRPASGRPCAPPAIRFRPASGPP